MDQEKKQGRTTRAALSLFLPGPGRSYRNSGITLFHLAFLTFGGMGGGTILTGTGGQIITGATTGGAGGKRGEGSHPGSMGTIG